ncbi:formylglycine-generating enzyme family protein [Candidimonas nitroreducens]|uniref:Sulfatase n=1 Tax=Candidimonas nitroreducens TaxID=683354 RepID=A0A225LZU0_9BURK|nr:formylglycine-generating enzyme family protein [Candidimonas nitroreducens]OWT53473.1 sulfatase [Candidimonas nitroreducens]
MAFTSTPRNIPRKWLLAAGGALAASLTVAGAYAWYGFDATPSSGTHGKPPVVILGDGATTPKGMAWIPPGVFQMGSDSKMARTDEKPAHPVRVQGFWMDVTDVTNDQFAAFVHQTGYVTTAEQKPDWNAIRVQLPPGTPKPPDDVLVPGGMVFVGTAKPVRLTDYSQWWRYVPGADWRHPQGPGSSIEGKGDYPVVQISYTDVQAYAKWAGKRMPTEAEWEHAARGGLEQADYAWGNQLEPDGKPMANYWDSSRPPFPVVDPRSGAVGTMQVKSFLPNGYGLYDMTGNVWQWVADWYDARYFAKQAQSAKGKPIDDPRGPDTSYDPSTPGVPVHAPKRVIRGGSFLCNESYCLSYRPSARMAADPDSPMSHIGFRLVQDAPAPTAAYVAAASRRPG